MVADTHDELETMARRLKLSPAWIQKPGTWEEHYDISEGKRKLAVFYGAQELTLIEMAKYLQQRRDAHE